MPRMTNTFMLAGQDDPEEIIRSVPRGLYAVEVRRRAGRHHQRQVRLLGQRGLPDRGRELTAPVKGATLIGNGPEALTRVTQVGNDLAARRGHRHLRQGRAVGAGRRRAAHDAHRRDDGRRDPGMSRRSSRALPQIDLLATCCSRAGRAAPAPPTASWSRSSLLGAVRLGEVETVKHSREQRLSLRVFAGRASAAASTSDLSPESLERGWSTRRRRWRGDRQDPHGRPARAAELAARSPTSSSRIPCGHELEPEEKIELARRARRAALESDPAHHELRGRRVLRRPRPLRLRAAATASPAVRDLVVQPLGLAGRRPERGDAARLLVSRHPAARALDSPEAIGRTAARRALRRLGMMGPQAGNKAQHGRAPTAGRPEMVRTRPRSGQSCTENVTSRITVKLPKRSVTP